FGHISQLPQLFAGFGIGSAVLFRGLDSSQVKHEFTWKSPDGSKVLGILMEAEWAYSTLWYALRDYCECALPYDRDDIVRRISSLRDKHAARANTGVLLFMDGVDHATAWHDLSRTLQDANASIPDLELRKSHMSEYISDVTKALAGTSLECVSGELRQTCHKGMSDVFMGTMASRIHLKQANANCERMLSQLCEPLSVIARQLGMEYPTRYLDLAWHYLLLNHPHDSICGCSVDQVHKDMSYRFDQARLIAERQAQERLEYIAARVEAKETADATGYLLFNPDTRPSPLVVRLRLPLDKEWQAGQFTIAAADGKPLRFQILDSVHDINLVKELQATPRFLPETRFDMIIELAEPIPPLGYMTINVHKSVPSAARPEVESPMSCVLENEFLRVEIHAGGTLAILEKTTGHQYDRLLSFEDVGDVGDGWKFRPAPDAAVSTAGMTAEIQLLNNGQLATRYLIRYQMTVPESASKESGNRSAAASTNTIASTITLMRGCPYLLVETTVENITRDHAIRAVFPTGLPAANVSAGDTPFDVVERPISLPDTAGWNEPAYSSWPRQSFVDISDGVHGLAILSEGLYEYDVKDDQTRTLSVMLLRGFANVIGRPHDEGGQDLGTHHFRYAIFPHAGDWRSAMLPAVAQAFRSPPMSIRLFPERRGKALPVPERTLPSRQSFLSLQPESLILTALKKAEDTDNIIVRYYNPGDRPVDAVLTWWLPIKEAYLTDLDEQRGTALALDGACVSICTPPRKIITVELVE
ncbi:MAG: glycoside hydrolase family 38 C-terminal domain-containing protein, partial [Victivallales bacterium]